MKLKEPGNPDNKNTKSKARTLRDKKIKWCLAVINSTLNSEEISIQSPYGVIITAWLKKEITDNLQRLETMYTKQQIATIAHHGCGQGNIKMITALSATLRKLNYPYQEIFKIASQKGGRRSLEVVEELTSELTDKKKCGYTTKQVIQIASKCGGSGALRAIATHHNELRKIFTPMEIFTIANRSGGKCNVTITAETLKNLTDNGYKKEQIHSVAICHGARTRLKKLQEFHCLLEEKYSHEEIVKAATSSSSKEEIENLLKNTDGGAAASTLLRFFNGPKQAGPLKQNTFDNPQGGGTSGNQYSAP